MERTSDQATLGLLPSRSDRAEPTRSYSGDPPSPGETPPRRSLDETRPVLRYPHPQPNSFDKRSGDLRNNVALLFSPCSSVPHSHQYSPFHRKETFHWNEKFQKVLHKPECLEKYESLVKLATDFLVTAKTFGKIIISEMFLPYDEKTIKPATLGGVAGGEKFIVRGIFFKLAVNRYGLYDSDEFAAKVAGHELKSLSAFYNAQINDLHLPLAALIDYRGYRLYAVSRLPIRTSTLKYGSRDAAKTVVKANEELNGIMEEAGRKLNLKEHVVHGAHIAMPVDIEVHEGIDGRFYVCDCARLFPCEAPLNFYPPAKGAYLYRLFRPEFVRDYPLALSSDAFSPFDKDDPERFANRKDVTNATLHLHRVVIPQFVRQLEADGAWKANAFVITQAMHRAGINVRCLLEVYEHVTAAELRTIVLTECVVRVIKRMFRAKQRELLRTRAFHKDAFKLEVLALLNVLFGREDDPRTEHFWRVEIKQFVAAMFGAHRIPFGPTLRAALNLLLFFERLEALTGVIIADAAVEQLCASPDSFVFVEPDVPAARAVVRQLNVVTLVEAALYLLKAAEMHGSHNFMRLFQSSRASFERAVQHSLDEQPVLYKWASMLFHCSKRCDWSSVMLSLALKNVELASAVRTSRLLAPVDLYVLWGSVVSVLAATTGLNTHVAVGAQMFRRALECSPHALEAVVANAQTKQREELVGLVLIALADEAVGAVVAKNLDVGPVVVLEGCRAARDDVIRFVLQSTTSTVVEMMLGETGVSDAGLEDIARCVSLITLDVVRCGRVSADGVRRLVEQNRRILWVFVEGVSLPSGSVAAPGGTPLFSSVHLIDVGLPPPGPSSRETEPLLFLTGRKYEWLEEAAKAFGWAVEVVETRFVEKEGDSAGETARRRAVEAARRTGRRCCVEVGELVVGDERVGDDYFTKESTREFGKEHAGKVVDVCYTLGVSVDGESAEIFTSSLESIVVSPPRKQTKRTGWDAILVPLTRHNTLSELVRNPAVTRRRFRHVLQMLAVLGADV